MTDEIFTGIRSQYKEVNSEYVLFRTKIHEKKSDIAEQKSGEQPDTTDMPDLESEESVTQRRNQQGQGLKILTPNQMLLIRLPISLAQLKAGNNLQNLKKEISQLLDSLCRSKNLQNNSIKVRLTLFKNGNNCCEQRKQ